MVDLDLDEIIKCLSRVAKILHERPEHALKKLRNISSLIDNQVPYRDGHMQRVCKYSLKIGEERGLTGKEMVRLEAAALLHDFGKLGIDEKLLIKPGPLTTQERIEVQLHVLRGYYMIIGFPALAEVAEAMKAHHEHYDGTGYPLGLKDDRIPLLGRIIAVADAYDAMTSDRPYRKAKTKEQAIEELERNASTQFDPDIVEAFIEYLCK